MISPEIKTPFRWYSDIEYQNRYKDHCIAACNFKLLTPLNSILPFQIRTTDNSMVGVLALEIYCAESDELYLDITSAITISTDAYDGFVYVTYLGGSFSLSLPCGSYYMRIETDSADENEIYYSEVFYVEDFSNPSFSQMDFPLKTIWRWYDNQDKQSRNFSACESACEYYLLSGNDALLPFMFRKPHSVSNTINSWVLRDINETCDHTLDSNLYISIYLDVDGYDYVVYDGASISDIPCGTFQSVMTINGVEYYSEIIKVVDTITNNTDSIYILQETGDLLLQQSGSGLLIE